MKAELQETAAPGRPTLSARAYEELRRAIVEGRLTDRDPFGEDDLAESLGVSRTPVREALLRLEMEGYLARDPSGRLFAQQLTAKDVYDVFLVRELLECCGVGLAAERVSDDEMETLDGVLSSDFQASERNQLNQMARLNEEFHRVIQRASRNRLLADLTFDLGGRIPGLRSFVSGTPAENRSFVDEHATILRAIRRGDGAEAEHQMRQHLRRARDLMLAHLADATDH